MTSDAYVWVWLPGRAEPVVAGRLVDADGELVFTYGRSYLTRDDAIALAPVGPALVTGPQRPPIGMTMHGAIRDAAPDSWGMRVIARRVLGAEPADTNELPPLRYLVEAGSNRIGALDFQASPTDYEPRGAAGATLAELVEAGDRLARGEAYAAAIDEALTYGSSIGGARPKVLLTDGERELIAKFAVTTDRYPWEQAEAVGMEIARRCGVTTAPNHLTAVAGRDVLVVERFDRPGGGTRRIVLSGLTLLDLNELAAHYGTYVELADQIRTGFTDPDATLAELFRRIAVNITIGNTDDHPRNIAAFWDGRQLELTPAYDLCPQPRSTGEATQVMAYGPDGERRSRLKALAAAAGTYHVDAGTAADIIDRCAAVVLDEYDDVCDTVGVTDLTRDHMRGTSIGNPSIFYDAD